MPALYFLPVLFPLFGLHCVGNRFMHFKSEILTADRGRPSLHRRDLADCMISEFFALRKLRFPPAHHSRKEKRIPV
jgi:hypothetical protein